MKRRAEGTESRFVTLQKARIQLLHYMSQSEAASTQADLEAPRASQKDAPELERIEALLDRFDVLNHRVSAGRPDSP
jgi:hypothetical protein